MRVPLCPLGSPAHANISSRPRFLPISEGFPGAPADGTCARCLRSGVLMGSSSPPGRFRSLRLPLFAPARNCLCCCSLNLLQFSYLW